MIRLSAVVICNHEASEASSQESRRTAPKPSVEAGLSLTRRRKADGRTGGYQIIIRITRYMFRKGGWQRTVVRCKLLQVANPMNLASHIIVAF